jgi:hypothetical protein
LATSSLKGYQFVSQLLIVWAVLIHVRYVLLLIEDAVQQLSVKGIYLDLALGSVFEEFCFVHNLRFGVFAVTVSYPPGKTR